MWASGIKKSTPFYQKMRIDRKKCCYCGGCVGACPMNALELWETELVVDKDKCTDCGICVKCCPVGAIEAD